MEINSNRTMFKPIEPSKQKEVLRYYNLLNEKNSIDETRFIPTNNNKNIKNSNELLANLTHEIIDRPYRQKEPYILTYGPQFLFKAVNKSIRNKLNREQDDPITKTVLKSGSAGFAVGASIVPAILSFLVLKSDFQENKNLLKTISNSAKGLVNLVKKPKVLLQKAAVLSPIIAPFAVAGAIIGAGNGITRKNILIAKSEILDGKPKEYEKTLLFDLKQGIINLPKAIFKGVSNKIQGKKIDPESKSILGGAAFGFLVGSIFVPVRVAISNSFPTKRIFKGTPKNYAISGLTGGLIFSLLAASTKPKSKS